MMDLVLKGLTLAEAESVLASLKDMGEATERKLTKAEASEEVVEVKKDTKKKPKKTAAQKKKEAAAKKKAEEEAKAALEEEDEEWDDEEEEEADEDDEDAKYAGIKKWRELATQLVADGFNTEAKLLKKCQQLRGIAPALEKIPDENLSTRVSRAIEVLGE